MKMMSDGLWPREKLAARLTASKRARGRASCQANGFDLKVEAKVKQFRQFNNGRLPAWYHWALHLGTNMAILVASLIISMHFLPTVTSTEIFIFSGFFL